MEVMLMTNEEKQRLFLTKFCSDCKNYDCTDNWCPKKEKYTSFYHYICRDFEQREIEEKSDVD